MTGRVRRAAGQQWVGARAATPTSSHSISARSYRNQTTGEPFSWAILSDVMLPVVLWVQACQEHRIELFKVVRANSGNVGLRAQFDLAVQELVVVATEMRALEAEWGFVARAPPPTTL
jgi:hypothetical protein